MGEGVLRLMEAAVFFIVAAHSAPAETQPVVENPSAAVVRANVPDHVSVAAPVSASAVAASAE